MNGFAYLAILGDVGAVLSFIFGSRAMARYGEKCGRVCWTWRAILLTCVFLTILSAPLA